MSARSLVTAALLCVASLVISLAPPSSSAITPTATSVTSIPAVGALFFPSILGSAVLLGLPHECSASVVHSAGHDLVLTAAHCIAGSGVGYDFVPGYHDRLAPEGVWSAQRVYVNPAWTKHQDPQHDYAFLVMAAQRWHGVRRNIEDVTGAFTLGAAAPAGTAVTVDGYLAGVGDRPITCTAPVYYTSGFPSFDCAGFGNGTSGGPWLQGTRVVGVIGGLHTGGCLASTSYSAAFGADTVADLNRASTNHAANFVAIESGSGCPPA